MSSRTADCYKCGRTNGVTMAVGAPRCTGCKATWMTALDFKMAADRDAETKADYLKGPLQNDLGTLLSLVRVSTMEEIKTHLSNAREQLAERKATKPDQTEDWFRLDEAIKALESICSWLSRMQEKSTKTVEGEDDDEG